MKLEYLGHSCFKITASDGTRIVTDPYTRIGYELPPLRADFVTCSHFHYDHNFVQGVQGVREVITSPGSCERGGVLITGIPSSHDDMDGAMRGENTVYRFEADGMTVCHLGDIGEELTPRLIERIGKVDVLLVPVGGTYTIDARGALGYIEAIAPAVAVPMHYNAFGCTSDIAPVSALVRAAGKERCVEAHSSALPAVEKVRGKIVILEKA